MSETSSKLWSDFDGTAVALARKVDPRNWTKYPLKALPGFTDFLSGVIEGGADFAGFVSRRPGVRRWVTMRSISKLGISSHFTNGQRLVLTGSEEDKGRFLTNESLDHVVGMVEDKPHQLGHVLIGSLLESKRHLAERNHMIVLGAVAHARTQEYLDRLLTGIDVLTDVTIHEPGDGDYQLHGPSFQLDIVPLQPYSHTAGLQFAAKLGTVT